MEGKVVSGSGKGAYYVKLYVKDFEQKLGLSPFPGTLNIEFSKKPILKKKITIHKDGYADVDCYPVRVNSVPGFIVRSHKTTHPDTIIEVIASENLRKRLKVHDGDKVICELE